MDIIFFELSKISIIIITRFREKTYMNVSFFLKNFSLLLLYRYIFLLLH